VGSEPPAPEDDPFRGEREAQPAPCVCSKLDVLVDYAGNDRTGDFDAVERWLKTREAATITCTAGDGKCKGAYKIAKVTAIPAGESAFGVNGDRAVTSEADCEKSKRRPRAASSR